MEQWDTVKKDGIVTLVEFEDYYTDISVSIDRDDTFESLLRDSWRTPEPKAKVQEYNRVEYKPEYTSDYKREVKEEHKPTTEKAMFEDDQIRFFGIHK